MRASLTFVCERAVLIGLFDSAAVQACVLRASVHVGCAVKHPARREAAGQVETRSISF